MMLLFLFLSFFFLTFSFSYMVSLLFLEKNQIVSESLKVHLFSLIRLVSHPCCFISWKDWKEQFFLKRTQFMGVVYFFCWLHSFFVFQSFGWVYSLFFLFFEILLVNLMIIDAYLMIIPEQMTWGGILFVLLAVLCFPSLRLFWEGGEPYFIVEILFGAGLGFFLYSFLWALGYLLAGCGGLGGGDLKLFIFVGMLLGRQGVILSLMIGSLLSSFYIATMFLFNKRKRKVLPFAPGFCMGALGLIFYYSLYGEHLKILF